MSGCEFKRDRWNLDATLYLHNKSFETEKVLCDIGYLREYFYIQVPKMRFEDH
jgi:hypothetical protein